MYTLFSTKCNTNYSYLAHRTSIEVDVSEQFTYDYGSNTLAKYDV